MLSDRVPLAELNISASSQCSVTGKGLGVSSCVCATGHIKDPVPLIKKRRGLTPGGRFPPSFIHQVTPPPFFGGGGGGLTPQQQPGSYQDGEMMMMTSVFFWRKPEYSEETTVLRQVTDDTFHTYGLCPVQGLNLGDALAPD